MKTHHIELRLEAPSADAAAQAGKHIEGLPGEALSKAGFELIIQLPVV